MNPLLLGILKQAPELLAIAKKLADKVRGDRKAAGLAERVAALEQNEAQQAELVREMTRQLNDMTAVMKVLNARIALCLACALVALGVSLAVLWKSWAG